MWWGCRWFYWESERCESIYWKRNGNDGVLIWCSWVFFKLFITPRWIPMVWGSLKTLCLYSEYGNVNKYFKTALQCSIGNTYIQPSDWWNIKSKVEESEKSWKKKYKRLMLKAQCGVLNIICPVLFKAVF